MQKKCPPDLDQCEVTSNDIKLETGQNDAHQVMPVRFIDDQTGEETDPILIMKLRKNQQLDFKLIARKGTAQTHAKWSPVATCIMRAEPIVDLDQEKIGQLNAEEKQELVNSCPRRVFSFNGLSQAVEIEDIMKCNLCNECVKYTSEKKLDKAIRIDEAAGKKYFYTVESTGALPPAQIVLKAIRELKQKLSMLQ